MTIQKVCTRKYTGTNSVSQKGMFNNKDTLRSQTLAEMRDLHQVATLVTPVLLAFFLGSLISTSKFS